MSTITKHSAKMAGKASRPSYAQPWRAYNAAQTSEKQHVTELLRDLCDAVEAPQQTTGRTRIPLGDLIFCITLKVYDGMSARRTDTELRSFVERGFLDRAPHFNSVLNAMDNPDITPILKAMVEETAKPLRSLETDFAADSSGFSTHTYARWFDAKYGKVRAQSSWIKAHIMVGVKTNVITSIEVTSPTSHDGKWLRPLLSSTSSSFNVRRVSADKAYSSKDNLQAISDAGAFPLIPFKSNTRVPGPVNRKNPRLWCDMYRYYTERHAEFMQYYHRRSNVESTFAMIKRKFGGFVRSKAPTAQVNEVLCKALCHNLCCLVQSAYEHADGAGAA